MSEWIRRLASGASGAVDLETEESRAQYLEESPGAEEVRP
jgi:hypothetical protein